MSWLSLQPALATGRPSTRPFRYAKRRQQCPGCNFILFALSAFPISIFQTIANRSEFGQKPLLGYRLRAKVFAVTGAPGPLWAVEAAALGLHSLVVANTASSYGLKLPRLKRAISAAMFSPLMFDFTPCVLELEGYV
jgi:hypothetical protein